MDSTLTNHFQQGFLNFSLNFVREVWPQGKIKCQQTLDAEYENGELLFHLLETVVEKERLAGSNLKRS